eukprot:13318163-Heterocapsa_arctica.AAC.1
MYGFLGKCWMEAYCNYLKYTNMPELYQFSDKAASAQQGKFINGLSLGNKNHSTVKLMRSPSQNYLGQAEQTKRTSEYRHNKRKRVRVHIGRIEQNK